MRQPLGDPPITVGAPLVFVDGTERETGFLRVESAEGVKVEAPATPGLIQIDVWSRLTGVTDPSIGDRILTLSANRDEAFMSGCSNAAEFHGEWQASDTPANPYDVSGLTDSGLDNVVPSISSTPLDAFSHAPGGTAATLWSAHFEDHLGD